VQNEPVDPAVTTYLGAMTAKKNAPAPELEKLTRATQRVIRCQRTHGHRHCAEIARGCATGTEAAERILAELARTHSLAEDDGGPCLMCGRP
jgi:hypothetical protein